MAIPHFSFKGISKGKGQNIIASSSYMARKPMKDMQEEDLNKRYKKSYSTTKDHRLTLMMLPSGAPLDYNDPEICWNDLNALEKDRLAVRFLLPIPKELTEEQGIELAKEWAYQEFVSKGMVVQLSFHAEKDGNGNLHCHGLGSYRQLVNGQWADVKSHKAFVDENGEPLDKVDTPKLKNGKLQYDKQGNIKFVKGWQKLVYDKDNKPLLHEDGTPVLKDIRIPLLNEDGTQQTTKNGKYRKLAWRERKIAMSDLERREAAAEARKLWEKCINQSFEKHNIRDKDGNILKVDLRSYEEQDKDKPEDEKRIPTKHQGIGPAAELIKEENQKEMQRRKDIAEQKKLAQKIDTNLKVLSDYVEKELKPEEIFVSDYMQPIRDAINLKNELADEAHDILLDGYNLTGEDITKLQEKETLSDREQARLQLLQENKTSWEQSLHKVNTIRNYNGTIGLETHCRKSWRGLDGWKRYGYVKNRNKRQAEIYKSYLIHTGQLDPAKKNPDLSLPEKVTLNRALYSVINGTSVPGMKAAYDKRLSAQKNTRNAAAVTFSKWKDNAKSELHTPPATSDFEIMTVMQTVPERVTQLATNSRKVFYSAVPHDYTMEADQQRYMTRIKEIEQAEAKAAEEAKKAEEERLAKEAADRRAKLEAEEAARKERERLASEAAARAKAAREEADRKEKERLAVEAKQNALRQYQEWQKKEQELLTVARQQLATVKTNLVLTRTDREYNGLSDRVKEYHADWHHVQSLKRKYNDIEKEERRKEKESHFWNSYEANEERINEAWRAWYDADEAFSRHWPNGEPATPDYEKIRDALEKSLTEMEPSKVIRFAKKYEVPTDKLEAAIKALTEHRRNKPDYPGDDGDPAAGKKTQRTTEQKKAPGQKRRTSNLNRDEKEKKRYTGR